MAVRDTWYIAFFEKRDLPNLYRYAEKIRATHNQHLVDDFNKMCEDRFNDHRSAHIGEIEPTNAGKSGDLATNLGLKRCLDLITGASAVRWRYMGVGTGTGFPLATSTALVTEALPRADMTLFGWTEWASSSLRFGGIFGENQPGNAMWEAGIFDTATAGTMLCRTYFSALNITAGHIQPYCISNVIEFCPVMP